MCHLYEVKLIHRICDWDAVLTYEAPDARTARRWAKPKMAVPDEWIVVSARRLDRTPPPTEGETRSWE